MHTSHQTTPRSSSQSIKRYFQALSAALLLAGLTAPLAAQASPAVALHNEYTRIGNRYQHGSITRAQYKEDLIRWRSIHRQMKSDMHQNGGQLTKTEQYRILRERQNLGERLQDQRQH